MDNGSEHAINIDSAIFCDSLIPILERIRDNELEVCAILDFFLGKPYLAASLECDVERLIVNFREFDCFTYWETVAALYAQAKNRACSLDFNTYKKILTLLRYDGNKIYGYSSRKHYTTEWIADNSDNGIIVELTGNYGGVPLDKEINFMSENSSKYMALANKPEELQKIKNKEAKLSEIKVCYIPKTSISKLNRKQVSDGDLIALLTNIKGLDVAHVGFARWRNNVLCLQHASSQNMEVEISEEALFDYVMRSKHLIGIRVARLVVPL
ncbi:MAG: N-acetylmuramoyl-L-alanine amidase-like domain-containing protein [Bacteroidales bacterium]